MSASLALFAADRVAELAASPELCASVGSPHAERLKLRAQAARQALQHGTGFGIVAAIGNLVLDCISLPEHAAADGEADTILGASVGEEEAEHLGWIFGPAVAHAIAAGIAALAGLPEAADPNGAAREELQPAMENALEVVGRELDLLAPYLFGSLCRAEGRASDCFCDCGGGFDAGSSNLRTALSEQGLRSICSWAIIAVGRTLGYERLTPGVLWEWSNQDPLWALVLAKGALLPQQDAEPGDADAFSAPPDVCDMRRALLSAVLGMASPDVAFASVTEGDDVPMVTRASQLALHRAQLALCFAESHLVGFLAVCMLDADCSLKERLVDFLVTVLQVEAQQDDPGWADESYDALCVLHSVREAASELADSLARPSCSTALGGLLRSVAESAAAAPGFWRNCATLAFAAPAAITDGVCDLLRAGVVAANAAESPDFATLCVLAANAGVRPGLKEDGDLWNSLLQMDVDQRIALLGQLKTWTSPVKRAVLIQWCGMLSMMAIPDEPHPQVEAEEHPVASAPEVVAPSDQAPQADDCCGGVRALLKDAPTELRCAIDGKLVVDPVRSPAGHVFERTVLARSLQQNGGHCPLTGIPLSLQECPRDVDVRRRSVQWVRQQRSARPSKARPDGW